MILILWCTGLPVIMNPANSIAVGYTQVVNANLYFGSWATFGCILWICGSLARIVYGLDIAARATPMVKSRQGKWYALVAASVVVMGASIRVFKAFDCSLDVMKKAPTCKQTKFAISAGVIGTLFSIMFSLFQAQFNIPRQTEWAAAFGNLIIWVLGLIFITFGEGPGHSIGNLYFATWGSFILSILIFGECWREYMGLREEAANPSYDEEVQDPTMQDVPMEGGIANVSEEDDL